MIVKRVLRMCVLTLPITLVVLHGQKRLVSAEQPSAVDRNVPPQGSPELSLTTAAARAGGMRLAQGGNPACLPDAGDCCSDNGTPGCDDPDCCVFICDFDPFCCDDVWDIICAVEAADFCGPLCDGVCGDGVCGKAESCDSCPKDCGACICGSGAGDCCSGNGTPGCDDPACCATVCESDPFCCDFGWDELCADLASDFCGPLCGCIDGEACDDGDACTVQDTCLDGVCVGGELVDCDDGDACTDDFCDPGVGCGSTPAPAGIACGDQSDTDCDNPDTCDGAGTCASNTEPAGTSCESDGDPCTDDECDSGAGCIHTISSQCLELHEPGTLQISTIKNDLEVGNSGADNVEINAETETDPVYLFSGECYVPAVDLRIRGRGQDFVWARKYRSRIGPNTAQGNGWDFCYNIKIEALGQDRIVHDGNTRRDLFEQQPSGIWTRREFFEELSKNPDNTYTLTFANSSFYHFHPLDGSPHAGKIESIVDRNGNTISLDYDGLGRPITIHDPLDTPAHNRDITISYNADGFIESVTDFAGRAVTYEYYDGVAPGGNFGDLKSVTTPVVINTPEFPVPAGHEYPTGKTTVYTYSTGFADPRLNHNLLTITDPKGQTYLISEYAPTQNENDLEFDRIVRQTWGNLGDLLDFVYVTQVPSGANNFAVLKTILNDRVGNVSEYFYDDQNRLVMVHEYTGRANPDLPTAEIDNRPTAQLRPGDPPIFETRYEWNDDSLLTRIIHANLNEEVFVYDEGNPSRRAQGNRLSGVELAGPLGGDQPTIVDSYEYDPIINNDTNFVTREVDGRGNETFHEYDVNGNRTHTTYRIPSIVQDFEYNAFGQMTADILPDNGNGHRRRDEYTYYNSGPQLGYLHQGIVDAPNFALTTTYEYNLVGRVTRMIDARGHDTLYSVNQLDQTVRKISREVVPGGGVRYERDTFYDPNDNVVRREIQNKDDAGVLQPNTHFTEVYEYEILNRRTRTCEEVGDYTGVIPGTQQVPLCAGLPQADFITTEDQYDANRNRTLLRDGEATNGNQPTNTERRVFDERDLVFKMIRAQGDPDQSTTQVDYDPNKNIARTSEGIEGVPRVTLYTYDGYDRDIASADPMGNIIEYHYDANHNAVSHRIEGELTDVPGGAGNVRLSEGTYVYDEMDRLIRSEIEFFDTQTQAPIIIPGVPTPGKSTTVAEWSDNTQVTRTVNDNGHQELTAYDTANRESVVTDQLNNTMTYTYDNNDNMVTMRDVEKSDLGNPDEEFTTTYDYDGLDRLIQTVDNVGNTDTYAYDSRHNETFMDDALGHETRYVYDGINRPIKTVRDLNGNGANTAAVPGDGGPDIVTTQAWDDSSRRATQTDDSDNTTTYSYDALDRLVSETYEDQTVHSYTYDVHDNRLTTVDANGSTAESQDAGDYDLLDRLIRRDIVPGPGVANDITFENYTHDGLSRLVTIGDDDSLVTRSYDSLSNVTRETLNGQTTECIYDGESNEISILYPGGRHIECIYDELERKKTINDVGTAVTVATYDYVGPGRVTRREYGNGTRTDYAYDGITGIPNPPNDFGVKRIIGTTHTKIAGGATLDDRTFGWDKMYNKLQRKDIFAPVPLLTHDYTYDDIYRLVHTTVTDGGGGTVRDTNYDLDGVGNRTAVGGAPDPGPHVGPYTMDSALPQPADFQMNQYTTTSAEAREHDDNGNLIDRTGLATIMYDYRNQMVEYTVITTGERHTYAYDALGRRIVKVVDADGAAGGPAETRYFYDGWQVCEEQDGGNATLATYVYGRYIDEVLNMQRGGEDFFYHADDLGSVMALTGGAGDVVERYEYGDYGQPTITDAEGCDVSCPFNVNSTGQVAAFELAILLGCWGPVAPGVCACLDIDNSGNIEALDLANLLGSWGNCPTPSSGIGNPYLFTGRRWDPETAWYHYRTRYLDPVAGRFTSRDVIGMWGDRANLGNGYTYVGNNPATRVDPLGLAPEDIDNAFEAWDRFHNMPQGSARGQAQKEADSLWGRLTPDEKKILERRVDEERLREGIKKIRDKRNNGKVLDKDEKKREKAYTEYENDRKQLVKDKADFENEKKAARIKAKNRAKSKRSYESLSAEEKTAKLKAAAEKSDKRFVGTEKKTKARKHKLNKAKEAVKDQLDKMLKAAAK